MIFRHQMASSACRGLARVGRRCRTPVPVVRPLSQEGLESRGAAAPTSHGVGVAALPCRSFHAQTWGRGLLSMPQGRRDYSSSSSSSSSASKSATFSTNATADGGEGEGPAEANGERGAAEDTNATPEKGTEDDDENPLEGYAEDDADPGPPPPLDPSVVSEPSPKVLAVMEGIDSLNFMELAMLIDIFKNKLGLEEVPTLNYGGSDGASEDDGGSDAPAAAADKTIFKVKVTGFGEKAKIKVIKEVRGITGLGLREAKEVVESLPQVVKEDLKQEEAEAMKAALEAAGATVELE